ncbi:uncharacterized protein SPSK_08424 [Sporothrix schenckii 1099-18]|uniref:SUN domain-containing protein n=1 Tax=Sporothrix schenckii 1099-18 TaxID=1397361 RepID=A0A0F2M6C5_SPOSC|nr:uncharacterized protein SPSK_08424 [Sporothrix schenckii 1099-18]KJR84355.1 hypothetical protein SPSK_08424 [Sporothrix schenckii 1099-18]
MPPRRSTRVTSSSLLFDGSSEAGGPLDSSHLDNVQPQSVHTAVGRGMSPGPAKYSSAYGSPPTILPTRQNVARQRYNFSSALSHVVDAVEQDNENDARERAQREAEQEQRLRAEADKAKASQAAVPLLPPAPVPSRPADETLESVELVREPVADRESEAANTSDRNSRPGRKAQPTATGRSSRAATETSLPREQRESSPELDFVAEEQLFAETRIFSPVVPARTTSVVSRTSNILQNILNSARRISNSTTTTREEPDDEAIRQAYPQFRFIRPSADDLSANANSNQTEAEAARPRAAAGVAEPAEVQPPPATTARTAATGTTGTPGTTRAAAKSIKSRIATPGPGFSMRNRKSLFKPSRDPSQDELASNDNDVETVASARSLLSRRRTPRAPSQPVAEPRQRASTEDTEVLKPTSSGTASKRVGGIFVGLGQLANVLAMIITVAVLGLVALRVFVVSTSPAELYQGYRVDNRLRWYGSDWRSNLRQLVPFALVHPLGAISDDEFARMNGLLLSHANEIAQLKHADRLHSDALDRIGRILPRMVQMELDRHGRPVISQEFWHALKENMQADKDIFSLIWNKDGSMAISDLQLAAIKRQLQSAGLLADPNTKALSVADVEGTVTTTVSKSFESWLRQNQKKVQDILGTHAPKDHSTPSPSAEFDYGEVVDRLSESQVVKLANLLAASPGAKQILVSRQEFLQHLQNSFVEHRLEIKGEIADLETHVVDAARVAASALSLAQNSPTEAPPTTTGVAGSGGLGKREVTALVDQLVRRIITDTQLEAMARGKIKAHWDADLIQQINFFTQHHGATINHHFSSPTYEPTKSLFGKLVGGGSGGSDVGPSHGLPYAAAVFAPWEQDGDCWCGATKGSSRARTPSTSTWRRSASGQGPTDIGIKLGLRILPQFLVLEHISPSATLDPGATPKDLEVWMQITDYAQQQPLHDWSMAQFPDTDDREPLFGYGFVKVGEFVFETTKAGGVAGGGSGAAQVFRLSPDLETLDATTDHVIVRAVSNYGDQDHTCFYRIRMYGQHRPDVVE